MVMGHVVKVGTVHGNGSRWVQYMVTGHVVKVGTVHGNGSYCQGGYSTWERVMLSRWVHSCSNVIVALPDQEDLS